MIKWCSACVALTACMQGIVEAYRGDDPIPYWFLAAVTLVLFVCLESSPKDQL